MSGGFVHSRIWMEILADITGKDVVLLQTEDASAIGAAYMAIKAVGLQTEYPSSKNGKQIIKPNQRNHKLYVEMFRIYQQLYPGLKDSMHQLHLLGTLS
ncbi:L-xylulose/3-keto-L-gulonate kinase [compost metagenome]